MTNQHETIQVSVRGRVCYVTLARPHVHNAFNARMIEELHAAFDLAGGTFRSDPLSLRAIVLAGEGPSFCAGADVNWMRESLKYSYDENREDAARMAAMFRAINSVPLPVIARVHGLALGGGSGLAAVADIVVAAADVKFAFSEVKLGIAPAVISPFVLAKIGPGNARALFLTGERFGAERALQIGLAHLVVPEVELDSVVQALVAQILSSAPGASARAKALVSNVPQLRPDEVTDYTVDTIATLRTAPEGQEGLTAFLEKRKPSWTVESQATDSTYSKQ